MDILSVRAELHFRHTDFHVTILLCLLVITITSIKFRTVGLYIKEHYYLGMI